MTLSTFARGILAATSLSLCLSSLANAQDSPKPKHLKSDQLLIQAAAENGLGTAAGTHPWHVRAQFETFDEQGKHSNAGIFEEWWFGPKSYKSTYTSEALKQTDVATDAGLFRSGDPRWATPQEALVPVLLTDPLKIHPYSPQKNDLTEETHPSGSAKLRCVILLRKPARDEPLGGNLNVDHNLFPSYCFDAESTQLRYSTGGAGSGVVILDDIVQLQGHYVARVVRGMNAGKESVHIHILDAGPLAPDAAVPAPPEAGTAPLGGRIELPPGRMQPISGLREAMASIDERPAPGTVVEIKVVIGKDGHVLESTVVSGPPDLAATVARAARKVVYDPFTILGTPVEVVTTYKLPLGGRGGPGR
jgi:hypothetical protein